MLSSLFFPADAHEGPVWVAEQCRLYFTSATHLDGNRQVSIYYLDFSALGTSVEAELWDRLDERTPANLQPKLFLPDARMANGMVLGNDGRSLLVAEQGDEARPSVVSSLQLSTSKREVLIDGFQGKPFNSLNKVIQSRHGHLLLSDPDYGFRQSFRPPPTLEPNLYVRSADGALQCFRCGLEMPHGLALSPDERTLFVSDTSNDGAHQDEGIQLHRRRSVWAFAFDPVKGQLSGPGTCCFSVDQGIPDGLVTTADHLIAAAGDGLYVADLSGQLVGKIPTAYPAVNLTLAGDDRHLFVTVDEGVLLIFNWRDQMEQLA